MLVPSERVIGVSVYADDASASNCLGVYPPRVARLRFDPERVLALEPDLVCISGYNEIESVRILAAAGLPLLRQSHIASFAEMTAGLRLLGAALAGADARRRRSPPRSTPPSPTSSAGCAACAPFASSTTIRSATRWGRGRSSTRSSRARAATTSRASWASAARARSASRRCWRWSPRPSSCRATPTSRRRSPRCRAAASGTASRPSPRGAFTRSRARGSTPNPTTRRAASRASPACYTPSAFAGPT